MTSVLRRTTFDLEDGTGDYLEVDCSLTAIDGEVELVEISHVQLIDWETGLSDEWDLLGYELAEYRDKITRYLQRYFADSPDEIRAEIATIVEGQRADHDASETQRQEAPQ